MAIDQKVREYTPKFRDVVARAWADEGFKARLLADPRAVLIEQGVDLPPDKRVRLIEPVEGSQLLLLPPNTVQGATLLEELLTRADGPARDQTERYAQLVRQAWADSTFHSRLRKDPRAAVAERGIDVPAGAELRVLELASDEVPLLLPPKPGAGELSDAQLDLVVGGYALTTGEKVATLSGVATALTLCIVVLAAVV